MAFLDEAFARQVEAEAKQINWARAFLTALAAVFYGVGWLSAKVFTAMAKLLHALSTAASWSVAAVKLGWREGRPATPART